MAFVLYSGAHVDEWYEDEKDGFTIGETVGSIKGLRCPATPLLVYRVLVEGPPQWGENGADQGVRRGEQVPQQPECGERMDNWQLGANRRRNFRRVVLRAACQEGGKRRGSHRCPHCSQT